MLHYHNYVHKKFAAVSNDQREEWQRAADAYHSNVDIIDAYDEILGLQLDNIVKNARAFVRTWSRALRKKIAHEKTPWARQVRAATIKYETEINNMKLKRDDFDGL